MDPDPQRPEAGAAGKRFRARLACLEALAWQARTANRTVPCRAWVETSRLRRQPSHQCSLSVPAK
jgi:hypothetical protein